MTKTENMVKIQTIKRSTLNQVRRLHYNSDQTSKFQQVAELLYTFPIVGCLFGNSTGRIWGWISRAAADGIEPENGWLLIELDDGLYLFARPHPDSQAAKHIAPALQHAGQLFLV